MGDPDKSIVTGIGGDGRRLAACRRHRARSPQAMAKAKMRQEPAGPDDSRGSVERPTA